MKRKEGSEKRKTKKKEKRISVVKTGGSKSGIKMKEEHGINSKLSSLQKPPQHSFTTPLYIHSPLTLPQFSLFLPLFPFIPSLSFNFIILSAFLYQTFIDVLFHFLIFPSPFSFSLSPSSPSPSSFTLPLPHSLLPLLLLRLLSLFFPLRPLRSFMDGEVRGRKDRITITPPTTITAANANVLWDRTRSF